MSKMRRVALYSAGFWLCSGSAAAYAQTDGRSNGPDAEEIVVTASKTREPLDRAPVAATTLSAADLAKLNVQSVRDAQVRLPSVVYNDSGGSAQVYIRGIGTNSAYAGLESSIGTYQDGVYLQRQVGASLDVVDLRSVEVLNGPQGSLYGRNATGGVILINTNDPIQRFAARARLEAGNLGRRVAEGMINVPLSPDIALRIAGRFNRLGGYVRNTATGERLGGYDGGTVRGKLKWEPDSRFSAVASVEYHKEVRDPIARRALVGPPSCLACAVYATDPTTDTDFYHVAQTKLRDTTIQYVAGTLNLKYQGEKVDVISVTGVRNFHYDVFVDQDYAAGDLFNTIAREYGTTFTEDAYARTNLGGPFNLLAGLSGEIDKDSLFGALRGDSFGALSGASGTSTVRLASISPYAEAYLKLGNFKLTVGGRYNIDRKKLHAVNDAASVLAVRATPDFRQRVTFKDFTPRVVLSHETGTSTVYASFSKGAKSGGYNTPAFSPVTPLRPEHLTSYEAGIKAHSRDGRITVSAAGFYYDYKDIQVSFVDATSGGVRAENAASARNYGMEFNASIKPLPGLTLSGGGLLERGRFRRYRSAAIFCPRAQPSPGYPGCPAPSGAPGMAGGVADLSGAPLPRAPDLSYSLAADYSFRLPGAWKASLNVADRYSGAYDMLPGAGGPLQLSRQAAYHFVNASLTLSDEHRGIDLRVFVENLTSSHFYLDNPTSAFGAAASSGTPRIYGLSIGYSI